MLDFGLYFYKWPFACIITKLIIVTIKQIISLDTCFHSTEIKTFLSIRIINPLEMVFKKLAICIKNIDLFYLQSLIIEPMKKCISNQNLENMILNHEFEIIDSKKYFITKFVVPENLMCVYQYNRFLRIS